MNIPRLLYKRVGSTHMLGCLLPKEHEGDCKNINAFFGKLEPMTDEKTPEQKAKDVETEQGRIAVEQEFLYLIPPGELDPDYHAKTRARQAALDSGTFEPPAPSEASKLPSLLTGKGLPPSSPRIGRMTGDQAGLHLESAARDYAVAKFECEGKIRTPADVEPSQEELRKWAIVYALAIRDDERVEGEPILSAKALQKEAPSLATLISVLTAEIPNVPTYEEYTLPLLEESGVLPRLHKLEMNAYRVALSLSEMAQKQDADPRLDILDVRQLSNVLRQLARKLLETL